MKKAILFMLMLSILSLAACADTNDNEAVKNTEAQIISDEPAEPEKSYYDDLGERDFEGGKFTILDANYNPDIWANTPEGIIGEPVNDALIARNSFIEEKYNVNIEYVQIAGYNTGTQSLKNSVAAGENLYDMVISTVLGGNFDTLSQNNVLYNLAEVPHLSLTSPWWSKHIYDNMTFKGKLFYTAGDIVPSMYQAPAAIYVNKRLLSDYAVQENLYDLVFEGKWTIDILEKIIKDMDQDLNSDGNLHIDDDFFGLVTEDNSLTSNAFATAMGIKLATVQSDTITIDFTSVGVAEKIDRLAGILKKVNVSNYDNVRKVIFQSGRSLFLMHYLESALLLMRGMDDDYGILPMPKYNEQQESYVSFLNAWNSCFIAVPLHADVEKAGFVMEAMAYASYEMVRPNIYELALKTKFTRDSESARAIDIIIESSYIDLNGIYNFGGSADIVRNAIFEKQPLISAYEAKENAVKTAIDKFIAAISE